ncbi:MAG: hypothetical protein ABIQ86_16220 [Steroidobacteraceae bacterium]
MRKPSRAQRLGLGVAAAALFGFALTTGLRAQFLESRFVPVTDAQLLNPHPNDWLMWRRTLDLWGYADRTFKPPALPQLAGMFA